MKALAQKFLTEEERENIDACIHRAEQKTSGEIVVMVVSASSRYPTADVVGSAFCAAPPALLLMPYIGGWFWVGSQNVWVFLGLFTVCFAVCHEIIKRTAWLKRLFVSAKAIDSEVKEAAVNGFFKQGLYRTRRSTGVLVFVSVFEKRVWILADRGIDTKLEPAVWRRIVAEVVKGIREGRAADAVCHAVAEIGRLLEAHFPLEPDDTDELKGVIIGQ